MHPAHLFSKLKFFISCLAGCCFALSLASCSAKSPSAPGSLRLSTPTPTQLLYVTNPTSSGGGTVVTAMSIGSDGALSELGTALQTSTPTDLLMQDTRGHHVFGVTRRATGNDSLVTFNVLPTTGTLQQTSTVSLSASLVQAQVNAASTFIFASLKIAGAVQSGGNAGSISTYAVDGNGNLTLASENGQNAQLSVPVAPASIAVNPAGTFLYAATFNTDQTLAITQYSIDANGLLTPINTINTAVAGGSTLVMAPEGNTLYWGIYISPQVVAFTVDPSTGNLTRGATVGCNCATLAAAGVQIAVNAPGTLMSQTTQGETSTGNGVLFYTVNPSSGALSPVSNSFISVNSNGVPSVVSDSSGQFFYMTGPGIGQILEYSVTSSGIETPLIGSPFMQAGGGGLTLVSYTP